MVLLIKESNMKKKKKIVTIYKQGNRFIIAYTTPDGQRIAFESQFKNK